MKVKILRKAHNPQLKPGKGELMTHFEDPDNEGKPLCRTGGYAPQFKVTQDVFLVTCWKCRNHWQFWDAEDLEFEKMARAV
jgi:hypothetical protein